MLEPKESPKEEQKIQDKSSWKQARLDYVRSGIFLVLKKLLESVLSAPAFQLYKFNRQSQMIVLVLSL